MHASLVPQIFSKRGGKKGSMHYLTRSSGLLLALQMQWVVQEVILSLFILPLQFDYEGFVYDCFENGDTFPVLESLVIRNLKLSTESTLSVLTVTVENENWSRCMHESIMQ